MPRKRAEVPAISAELSEANLGDERLNRRLGLLADQLAARPGDARDWDRSQRLWTYSGAHMVDHEYGAWFRILDADNRKYSDEKSPAGKTDYHTMGACHEVLNVVRRDA